MTATENEHDILEHNYFRPFCKRARLSLEYYRKFKTGHIPMQRECKIDGFTTRRSYAIFLRWMQTRDIPIMTENYWRNNKYKYTK